jgi:hypothetical protein
LAEKIGIYLWGFFDMDLRKIISYNNYEGFRGGFWGITNDRFLKISELKGIPLMVQKTGILNII